MSKNQWLGVIGSALLLLGVFTPVIKIHMLGNFHLLHTETFKGVIILLLAVLSFILVIVKIYKGLLVTGLLSLAFTLLAYLDVRSAISQAKEIERAFSAFGGVPSRETIQLQWGWILLVIGAILLIVAAVMKEEQSQETISLNG